MRLYRKTRNALIAVVVICVVLLMQRPISYHENDNFENHGFQFFPSLDFSNPKCILKSYDIWDPEITKHVSLDEAKISCTNTFKKITELQSGQLIVKSDEYRCEGRCVFIYDKWTLNYSDWQTNNNHKYECDIVEARCAQRNFFGLEYFTYGMIHSQIVEQRENKSEIYQKPNAYNLFVILIDSTGMSQAYRNLPRTMSYMEKSLQSVTFPHLNKVGLNSRPNCFALWFGIQLETIDRSIYNLPDVLKDRDWNETCNTYLDNETSIFDEFRSQGYKTMMGDDYGKSVDVYPYCNGFLKKFVDHKFQPFAMAAEEQSILSYTASNCMHIHKDLIKYQQQFIESYRDHPKFSWTWISTMSHNNESKSMALDSDLSEFLINNRKLLDESFFVIQGDHGFRFGDVARTELGSRDNNNPLFTMSLPKSLRNSPLRDQMVQNSKYLQTHYDVRATYLDIARYQPKSEFTDLGNIKIPKEKGQSMFRKQIGERSCQTLPIPFTYCICENDMKRNLSMYANFGQAVIEKVNSIVIERNLTNICNLWTFRMVESIFAFLPEEQKTYSLVVLPSYPYDKAQFQVTLREEENGNFTIRNIVRLDEYGMRANCYLDVTVMPVCDCISQE